MYSQTAAAIPTHVGIAMHQVLELYNYLNSEWNNNAQVLDLTGLDLHWNQNWTYFILHFILEWQICPLPHKQYICFTFLSRRAVGKRSETKWNLSLSNNAVLIAHVCGISRVYCVVGNDGSITSVSIVYHIALSMCDFFHLGEWLFGPADEYVWGYLWSIRRQRISDFVMWTQSPSIYKLKSWKSFHDTGHWHTTCGNLTQDSFTYLITDFKNIVIIPYYIMLLELTDSTIPYDTKSVLKWIRLYSSHIHNWRVFDCVFF